MLQARLVGDGTIGAGTGCGNNSARRVSEFGNARLRFPRIPELCEAAFLGLRRVQETADMPGTGGCRGRN